MTITVADYERAFDRLVDDMEALGDEVVSVVRFGSAARGEISPGKSDIVDAYVFLRPDVFDTQDRYTRVLHSFVETCQWLSATGIPYHHAFHYHGLDEAGNLPAGYIGAATGDESSDIIFGEDIRQRLGSSLAGREVMKTGFFTIAALLLRHAHLLDQETLDEQEARSTASSMTAWCKHLAQLACLALGHELAGQEALRYLASELPQADLGVLEEVRTLRDRVDPAREPEQVRDLLRQVLALVDVLHDAIVERLRASAAAC